jgi:hypothetical protein
VGKASTMCSATIRKTFPSSSPIVKTSSSSADVSAERKYAKPTAVMSAPVGFAGRRDQAKRPVPM